MNHRAAIHAVDTADYYVYVWAVPVERVDQDRLASEVERFETLVLKFAYEGSEQIEANFSAERPHAHGALPPRRRVSASAVDIH